MKKTKLPLLVFALIVISFVLVAVSRYVLFVSPKNTIGNTETHQKAAPSKKETRMTIHVPEGFVSYEEPTLKMNFAYPKDWALRRPSAAPAAAKSNASEPQFQYMRIELVTPDKKDSIVLHATIAENGAIPFLRFVSKGCPVGVNVSGCTPVTNESGIHYLRETNGVSGSDTSNYLHAYFETPAADIEFSLALHESLSYPQTKEIINIFDTVMKSVVFEE